MKWSKLKKRIKEHLADSVQDRFDFGTTVYEKFADREGRGWITIDGREIINIYVFWWDLAGYPNDINFFTKGDMQYSLSQYLNMSLEEILKSENPLIRAFGMLDARCGKRRLRNIDISDENELVQRLYYLRCIADKIEGATKIPDDLDLTGPLNPKKKAADKEQVRQKKKVAINKLALSKKSRNLPTLLQALYQGTVPLEDLATETAQILHQGFENTHDPEFLYDSLCWLMSKSKLLKDSQYVRGVITLIHEAPDWIRPLHEWKAATHNPKRQFHRLSRHLLAGYDVPAFMDKAWLQRNSLQQTWFKHIGRGGNMRTAEGLPTSLTKKMAHFFLRAPDDYSIDAAFRWGQVHALGGDRRLADALLDTRLLNDFGHDPFWLSVIRFFIRNPMLDTVHINPIIDFIWHQRFENQVVFVARGVAEEREPAQPNFSMRGRTVETLLRQVKAWHEQLGRQALSGDFQWQHSEIRDFKFIEGSKKAQNTKVWRIYELVNSEELKAEGKELAHCVSTYGYSCHQGHKSIWSMSVESDEVVEKCVTIELENKSRTIRQVRGKRNRYATEKEMEILRRWARKEELTLADYL